MLQTVLLLKLSNLHLCLDLDSEPHRIVAVNNSNGVGIVSMTTSQFWYCNLHTDHTNPWILNNIVCCREILFSLKVLKWFQDSGTGYNSEDYDYKFFQVISYNDTSPAVLTFKVVGEDGVGLTTNPGIAKTYQSGYATIINKNDYPDIKLFKKDLPLIINEALFVDIGTGFFKTDLTIALVRDDYIKINGDYNLSKRIQESRVLLAELLLLLPKLIVRELSSTLDMHLNLILVGEMILVRLVKTIRSFQIMITIRIFHIQLRVQLLGMSSHHLLIV